MQELPEHLREFINGVCWMYAKTMPDWPHEYIVRQQVDYKLFVEFVEFIRKHGEERLFYKRVLTYYDDGDLTYWTMGAPVLETTIINRAKIADSYEQRLKNGTLPHQIRKQV
jgi:hypothetical protein